MATLLKIIASATLCEVIAIHGHLLLVLLFA